MLAPGAACPMATKRAESGQGSGKRVTERVEDVIGPVGRDRLERKLGPLWELADEQAIHEREVGLDLVGMHLALFHRSQQCLSRSVSAVAVRGSRL